MTDAASKAREIVSVFCVQLKDTGLTITASDIDQLASTLNGFESLTAAIAVAITEAVAEERERAGKLVEAAKQLRHYHGGAADSLAPQESFLAAIKFDAALRDYEVQP